MSKAAADTLEKVSGEFEHEVLADLEEGRKESFAILETSRKETSEAVAKILETSVKQADSLKRQVIGSAELEARNTQLRTLERAVNEVFDQAMKRRKRKPPEFAFVIEVPAREGEVRTIVEHPDAAD